MTTEADEKLEEARKNINLAYKNILEALNTDTWGRSQFNKLYIAQLHNCLIKLEQVKELIN
jgi:hypothetical protein